MNSLDGLSILSGSDSQIKHPIWPCYHLKEFESTTNKIDTAICHFCPTEILDCVRDLSL